jgi:hypothetical protein
VPADSETGNVPVDIVVEFAGAVGPESHVTLWLLAPLDQEKVTVPTATVSGVGEKKLLETVIVVR